MDIGIATTEIGHRTATKLQPDTGVLVHALGSGIMASITALEQFAGLPALDCSALSDDDLFARLTAFETVIFQGWSPRYRSVAERLPTRHRVLVQWHSGLAAIEQMGEGGIFADVWNCDRVEKVLWTHPEADALRHPRIVYFPNVAITPQFRWLVEAPRLELGEPGEFHLLQPTINRPVKNGLSAAFAAAMLASTGVPLRFHATQAFGASDRCGAALRALFGPRLTVHPNLPVRAPRWGALIKSAHATAHLSFSESYCYAAVESLVAGTPALLSSTVPFAPGGGLDFTVVDPADVPGAKRAIEALWLRRPEERHEIANAQLEVFRSWNRTCAERVVAALLKLDLDVRPCRHGFEKLL